MDQEMEDLLVPLWKLQKLCIEMLINPYPVLHMHQAIRTLRLFLSAKLTISLAHSVLAICTLQTPLASFALNLSRWAYLTQTSLVLCLMRLAISGSLVLTSWLKRMR